MIYINNVKQYCKEYWLIENYQEAVNDTTQPWACHHRYEIDYNMSALELQAIDFYFNRPPHELIFLTHAEHSSLHSKGKLLSEETKEKISNSLKGYKHSDESKIKISTSLKGKSKPTRSEDHKQHIKDSIKKRGGLSGENNPNYKYHITAEELYDLYIVKGLSQNQIAEMYGCTQSCIQQKLKKINIKK